MDPDHLSWSACDEVVEPPPLDGGTAVDGGTAEAGTADAGAPSPDPDDEDADARTKESVAINCCRPAFEIRAQACR